MKFGGFDVIEQPVSVTDFMRLRDVSGLSPRDAEGAAIGLANSLYGVQLLNGDTAITMGRIVGDGGLNFEIIDDDRITIENLGGKNATHMSSPDSEGYHAIAETVAETFGPILTAPSLTICGTDARHYYVVSDDVYRLIPIVMKPNGIKRMHGTNEYIHVDALAGQVSFFENLMKKIAQ